MNEISYNVIKAIRETEVAQALNRACQDYDRNGGEERKAEMMRADEILRIQLKEAGIKVFDRFQEDTDKGQMTVWMFRENEEHKDNRSAARMIEADEKFRAELKGAGIKIYERSPQETARGEWTVWLYRPNWNCDDADDPCRVALAGTTIRQNPHQVSIARPADGTPGPERLANMFKLG